MSATVAVPATVAEPTTAAEPYSRRALYSRRTLYSCRALYSRRSFAVAEPATDAELVASHRATYNRRPYFEWDKLQSATAKDEYLTRQLAEFQDSRSRCVE